MLTSTRPWTTYSATTGMIRRNGLSANRDNAWSSTYGWTITRLSTNVSLVETCWDTGCSILPGMRGAICPGEEDAWDMPYDMVVASSPDGMKVFDVMWRAGLAAGEKAGKSSSTSGRAAAIGSPVGVLT